MQEDALKWDKRHADDFMPTTHSELLEKFADILPKGRVLDIACGNGRNAKFLAKKGFVCECVDISSVAIAKLTHTQEIIPLCVDLDGYNIAADSYEVILDFYFLHRRLFEGIKNGLKVGGVFLMETFVQDEDFPIDISSEKILRKGELQDVFVDFEILFHNEIIVQRLGKNAKALQFCAKKKSK